MSLWGCLFHESNESMNYESISCRRCNGIIYIQILPAVSVSEILDACVGSGKPAKNKHCIIFLCITRYPQTNSATSLAG